MQGKRRREGEHGRIKKELRFFAIYIKIKDNCLMRLGIKLLEFERSMAIICRK